MTGDVKDVYLPFVVDMSTFGTEEPKDLQLSEIISDELRHILKHHFAPKNSSLSSNLSFCLVPFVIDYKNKFYFDKKRCDSMRSAVHDLLEDYVNRFKNLKLGSIGLEDVRGLFLLSLFHEMREKGHDMPIPVFAMLSVVFHFFEKRERSSENRKGTDTCTVIYLGPNIIETLGYRMIEMGGPTIRLRPSLYDILERIELNSRHKLGADLTMLRDIRYNPGHLKLYFKSENATFFHGRPDKFVKVFFLLTWFAGVLLSHPNKKRDISKIKLFMTALLNLIDNNYVHSTGKEIGDITLEDYINSEEFPAKAVLEIIKKLDSDFLSNTKIDMSKITDTNRKLWYKMEQLHRLINRSNGISDFKLGIQKHRCHTKLCETSCSHELEHSCPSQFDKAIKCLERLLPKDTIQLKSGAVRVSISILREKSNLKEVKAKGYSACYELVLCLIQEEFDKLDKKQPGSLNEFLQVPFCEFFRLICKKNENYGKCSTIKPYLCQDLRSEAVLTELSFKVQEVKCCVVLDQRLYPPR